MRAANGILVLAAVVSVGAVGGYIVAERRASALRAEQPLPVSKRAMDAYAAGRYAEAVPLLKEWAQSLNMKTDGTLMGQVLTYLDNARAQVKGIPSASGSAPSTMPTAMVTASVSSTGQANNDPSTGKPRVPHPTPVPGQLIDMTIKDLGNFEFDPTADTDIPADVKTLNGQKIRLRGFMIPLNQAEQITDFALVPSLVGCCFGQPPGVQHTITCKTLKGQAVAYTVDEIYVEGTVKINVQRDQGYTFSIFDLDVTSVKAVE